MKSGILVANVAVSAVVAGAIIGAVAASYEFAHEQGVEAFARQLSSPVAAPRVVPGVDIGRPKLQVIGTADFNFGIMEKGETQSHAFEIKNTGDAPLTLSKLDISCKCTTSSEEYSEIQPGESTEIELNWTPPTFYREFRQNATFKTNDPDLPILKLEIHGRVIQSLRATPDKVGFNNISANEPHTAQVDVYCYRDQDVEFEFDRFENSETAEHFDVSVEPMSAEDVAREPDALAGFRVTITVKPGLPLGPVHQRVYFRTNLEVKDFELPIYGSIAGDITLLARGDLFDSKRRVITIGGVPRTVGGEYDMHVLVKGPFANETEITGVEADPPDVLRVSVDAGNKRPLNKGYLVPMRITVPPNSVAVSRLGTETTDGARNYGKIIIKTTHPVTPDFLLYVKFAVVE